jgi:hypothetical protein
VGRKENVEEAKRRIVSQVERLVRIHLFYLGFPLIICRVG